MVCTSHFIVTKWAFCVVCSYCAPVCLCYYEDLVRTSPNFNHVKAHILRAVLRFMKYEPAFIVRFHLCVCFHFATPFFKYKFVIVAWLSAGSPRSFTVVAWKKFCVSICACKTSLLTDACFDSHSRVHLHERPLQWKQLSSCRICFLVKQPVYVNWRSAWKSAAYFLAILQSLAM